MTARSDAAAREVLAAEYVAGLLDAAEMAAVDARLADDPALAAAIAAWCDRLVALDETAVATVPAPQVWRNIEAAVDRLAAAPPHVAGWRAWLAAFWADLAFWRLTGLAGAAASLALVAGLALLLARDARAPTLIAVLVSETGRAGAVVQIYGDGSAALLALEPIAVPPGRALQVWTKWSEERGPVPLGLLGRAASVPLDVARLPTTQRNQLFEITLEPAAGSPTGRPTGPILYKGLAANPL